jgi:hypothetical protein
MEIARETGLDRMGEDKDDEEEEEDADDGEDVASPPATAPPPPAPPATVPEEIDEEGPVEAIPEQEAPMPHEVILADAEPVMPQCHTPVLESTEPEPPYACPGSFNHMHGNNMINR